MKEAVILAGGFGTRLQKVVRDLPKPMAPIGEVPFLSFLLDYLIPFEYDKVIISTGYLGHKIEEFYGNQYKSMSLAYAHEDIPLGTGGAIVYALSFCAGDNVLVLNGDTMFQINLQSLENVFAEKTTKLAVALRKVEDVSRYGSVLFDDTLKITSFAEKNQFFGSGYINGGVYMLNHNLFLEYNLPEKFSFEKDFMEKYAEKEDFYAYPCNNYFIDIGVPEDYERAQKEFPERFSNIIQ